MTKMNLSRRTFVQTSLAAGGGLLLGFHVPLARAAKIEPKPSTTPTDGVEINAWLAIDEKGIVTIRVPHTEMGQGGVTSVAMLIAEELDVEWSKIQVVFADANRHLRNNKEYKVMSTHGSQLVRLQHPHLMQAGASARERLKEAAAQAWGVERSAVAAKQGVLKAGNRTGTYAEFATAAAKITLDKEPAIKKPGEWWLLGSPTQRLDIPVKVNGSAQYAIDTRVPGMVYAAVKASPVPWGALKSYDFDGDQEPAGRHRRGRAEGGAGQARPAGPAERRRGRRRHLVSRQDRARADADRMGFRRDRECQHGEPLRRGAQADGREGSRQQGRPARRSKSSPQSKKVVTAEYERPFETHARMEPINATVHVQADRVDVWSPTQDQSAAILLVADQLGVDPKNVYAHTMFLGGGFGGNGAGGTGVTRQAAEISKQVGRPVKVLWSREEDIAQDKQRPLAVARLSAAIGEDGLPDALFTRAMWFSQDGINQIGGATADYGIDNMPYKVPNRHHERHNAKTHIPSSTHRAPGANQLGFMTESFVDEMAIAGGWNPLDWRIEMTKGMDDWQLVLKTLKEKAGFRTDLPKGEGMGIAVVESHGSIVAACATVSVSRRGQLAVEKIVLVIDSGHIINPHTVTEQAEGSVCWELSHAWLGGLELEKGRFTNTNFDTYNLVRINQMPDVEVHFAMSGGTKWGGLGEPAGPPTPPAVANAIYYATGKRIRSTPFKSHDLSWS